MTFHNRTAPTSAESDCATVFMAIELSRSSWVVAVHTPPGPSAGTGKFVMPSPDGVRPESDSPEPTTRYGLTNTALRMSMRADKGGIRVTEFDRSR